MTYIYLCLNSDDVISDIMVTEYEMIHPERIPWNIADYTLIGKQFNRCAEYKVCVNPDGCDKVCYLSDRITIEENTVTRLQFRQKFNLVELSTIYSARETDIIVNIFLDDLAVSEFVDMNDKDTQNGIGYLCNAGYVTYDRMTEILG